MTKGVVKGVFWAVVLGGAGLATASVFAPQPAGNLPPLSPQVDVPQTAVLSDPSEATPVVEMSDSSDVVATARTPSVSAPSEDIVSLGGDTSPLALPLTGDVGDDLKAPATGTSPDLAAETETPVLPNPQSIAPQVPVNEEDLQIETAPPKPVEVIAVETVPAQDEAVETANAPDVDIEVAAPDDPGDDRTTMVIDDLVDEGVPEAVDVDVDDPIEIATVEPEVADQAPLAVTAPSVSDGVELPAAEAPPAILPVPAAPQAPETITEFPPTTPQDDRKTPAEPPRVASLADGAVAALPTGSRRVKVNRGFGTTPDADEAEQEPPAEQEVVEGSPALDRFATPYDRTFAKPVMSLILLDDGGLDIAPRALKEVPFPVTVVIDGTAADAADRMAAFRAEGIEVAALLQLPEGARPSDVEVAIEATFAALPQTVALLDLGGASRAASAQILAALANDGRGFVSADNGLGSGVRAAQNANVPAVQVYRDIDGAGQDARAIRRFLDQAAFRARQDSGVVVMGRIEAETLSALILWGSANRAGQVDLVPLSAVLINNRDNAG